MALTPFEPGQSGNPGGRPKDASLRRLARARTEEAIETLVKIMLNEKAAAAARVSAATALLDRGWGRPIQPSAFVDSDGNDRDSLLSASDREPLDVARRIAFLLTQGVRALPTEPADREHGEPQANRDHDLQRSSEIPHESDTCDPTS